MMAARLTKRHCPCKGLVVAGLICFSVPVPANEAAERSALRACVEKASGLAAVNACEQQHQTLLLERMTSLRELIRQRLPTQARQRFDSNIAAWQQWLASEKAMLEITLLGRSDGLGASLYAGELTRIYEERVRQLRDHLHSLKMARN
jgi:hypothetical protein